MTQYKVGSVIHKHYDFKRDGIFKNKWHILNFLIYNFQKIGNIKCPNSVHSAAIIGIENDDYIIAQAQPDGFHVTDKFGIAWFNSKVKQGKWIVQDVKRLDTKKFIKELKKIQGIPYDYVALLFRFVLSFILKIKWYRNTLDKIFCSEAILMGIVNSGIKLINPKLKKGYEYSPGKLTDLINKHNESYS